MKTHCTYSIIILHFFQLKESSCWRPYVNRLAAFLFSFHLRLISVISFDHVLLSNFISSLRIATYHASLLPSGDIQMPGSLSFLYPLFLSSFEASCLLNILPPVSWITCRLRYPFAYRSRWRRAWVASCRGCDFTSRATTSSITMVIMIMVVIVMYI